MTTDNFPSALLIEQNKTDRFIFEQVWQIVISLKELKVTSSGEGALIWLSDEETRQSIRYIFLDLGMPGHADNSFLEQYENLFPDKNNRPKLVIMTSFMSDMVKQVVRRLQFDVKVIERPITTQHIKDCLERK